MKDKESRQSYYDKPCVVCGYTPCDPTHVKTYARTGLDKPCNLVPLCRKHHGEQSIGILTFIRKYDKYKQELIRLGWEIEPKLYHPEMSPRGIN